MRPAIFALGALALVTACNGGSPVPSASLSPPGGGAQYTYQTTTYGVASGLNGKPTPIPTSSASELSVITTNASFGGMHGLTEVARETVGVHGKSTSHEYYATSKSNGVTRFEEVAASVTSDSELNKQRFAGKSTTTFTKPFVVVEMPFSAGRTWSRTAAYRAIYDDRSSHPANLHENGETVYNTDGSYSSAATGSELGKILNSHEMLASDGSFQSQSRFGACRQTLDVGVPVMKSGTYAIPYALTAKRCVPVPIAVATTLPDWYPGGALPPSPLHDANATDMGATAVPKSCGVASSIATRGERIVVTLTDFDPLGTVAHGTQTFYFATGIGLVCTETISTSEVYIVTPPAAIHIGRSVIHSVRSLVSYTKGSSFGAPVGLGGDVQYRAVIVRAGGNGIP